MGGSRRIEDGRRRHSLRWRLPVLICGLFLLVLVVVVYAAYREVEATLEQAAADRARHAASQVANLLSRSTAQAFDQLQRLAPAMHDYLRNPTEERLAAARAAVASLAPSSTRRLAVWNAAGERMFEMPDASTANLDRDAMVPSQTEAVAPGASPLHVIDGRIFMDGAVAVPDKTEAGSAVIGSISVRSGVTLTPPDILTRLVGADARVLLGNRRGDVWTDFTGIVSGPTVDLTSDGSQTYQAPDGEQRIGAVSGWPGTPWVIWVELPRALMVERAQTFLQRMTTVAVLIAFVAVLLLRSFIIRVTAPLAAMTTAAETMASGDYSRRVIANRADEIGRLGRAFNVMASQVENDIARHTEAEALLRASEGRYRTLFDYAPDGILIADAHSNYLDANPSACRMLGYRRDELVGLNAIDIVVPPEVPYIAPALEMIVAGTDYQREWHFRRKDGSTFMADVIATKMPDGRLVGMIRDITERTQATEALRTAEERMRFALQGADVGIWDVDYRTGIVRVSEILEAQYGVQRGELGETFDGLLERIHPDDRASVRETVDTAKRSGADFSLQHRIVRPDRTVRWLTGAGRIHLSSDGKPLRGVGISLDVTERHSLEAQYQQAQKMEAVGRLAGGVAHDFNNLLTAILGYCDLMLDGLAANDPGRSDVLEIQKAGISAAALTRQLLTFSRKQMIEPTLLDLNVVVSEMRAMLARLIREDITIVVRLSPKPSHTMADRAQVEQIIMNLAVNARDAMPRGGTLTIETADVELDEHYAASHFSVKPGSYVMLTVTDTGSGMTSEVQSHLFEPFFTTKEVGQGTGLGLATVHGIVTRSGGSVGVYSELGKGTSFKVYLPRAGGREPVTEQVRPAVRPPVGSHTVLVVDDADSVRRLARRLLQRQGYKVLVAANATEALRLFDQHPDVDLLLTDVVMPGASGGDLTRELLEKRPALKVIFMSGYTEETISNHGVLRSGVAFLNKPFTSEALGRKIREVLEQ